MKILVCISKVPDTTAKIAFTDNNTKFDAANVQFVVNPYDEWYALVRALELTEASAGQVTIVNVGRTDNDPVIRKALAIGAHEAVRIDADADDAFFVAAQIAGWAKDQSFDIILTGKETIDYNGSQVGAMVAEFLGRPFISHASKLDVKDGVAVAEREIQGGIEVVETPLPFVASCAKGMAEARIPNMRGIMAARTKPLHVVQPVPADRLTGTVSYELPAPKTGCRMIEADKAAELIDLLHNEAKVI